MFYRVSLSYFGTSLGHSMALFFIPLIVFNITGSALMVSVAYALDMIPYILITPVVGVIGDKYNKKRIILIGEFLCFITALVLFFIPHEAAYVYAVMLAGFLISVFSAAHHPIFQAVLPEIFNSEELVRVNGNIASLTSLTGIIAPSIIGVLLPFIKAENIPVIMVLCYLLSMVSFALVDYTFAKREQGSFMQEFTAGINFVKENRVLKNLSYLFFFYNFGFGVIFVSLIWIYSTKFGLDNISIAIIFSLIGIASMLGAKIAAKYIVNRFSDVNIVVFSLIGIALLTLSNLLVSNYIYLTVSWSLASLLCMFVVVTFFTYRQKVTPKDILSKVISITRLISYLAIPPAAILSGYLANHYQNEAIIYAVGGMVMLISGIFFYLKLGSAENK